MVTGVDAEQLFEKVMGRDNVIKSSQQQDMFDHIDYFDLDGISYEVKGEKKLNRWDANSSDIIWLEIKNVRGDKGWLLGKANYIAFLRKEEFWIIDRIELLNFVRDFITDRTVYKDKQYKKLYSRKGRQDIVFYIYPEDIKHLIKTRLSIWVS